MNKLLKTLAPVMLVFFCSVCIVGPVWGEDFSITVKAPENVEVNKNIDVNIAFSKAEIENRSLNLDIVYSDGFISSTSNAMITQESYQLTFKAPTQESTATIRIAVMENKVIISHKIIQVRAYKAVDLNPIVAVGVVTLAVFLGGLSFLANLIAPGIAGMH